MRPFTSSMMVAIALLAASGAHAEKSHLRSGEYLTENQMLVSANRAFFAAMQGDGNFVVYKGVNFQQQYGALWSTGARTGGQYFAIQQSDGNFVVNRGTGPADNRGIVWHHQKTGAGGQFFTVMQDDGNLCTYKGTGPADNRGHMWCSGPTAPVTWIPDGKMIVLATGDWTGRRVFNGERMANNTNTAGTWLVLDKAQRWAFMPDTTLRMASDRGKCLRAFKESGIVAVGQCDGAANSTGWSYRAGDRTIRKSAYPNGCLSATYDGGGNPLPTFNQTSCRLDRSLWRLE